MLPVGNDVDSFHFFFYFHVIVCSMFFFISLAGCKLLLILPYAYFPSRSDEHEAVGAVDDPELVVSMVQM